MYFFTSSDFLITLFGFISSLAFNNRIENLILMTKFRGGPTFGGGAYFPLFSGEGGPEAVPLLPPSRAGPDGGRKVQFVLQLRVKPKTYSKYFGTLEVNPNVQFDKNIDNSELFWVIKSQQTVMCENDPQKKNGLLLYSIMLRFT